MAVTDKDQQKDQQAYSTVNADEQRDMAAKGGPITTLGIADDKHGISQPYNEDTQTQLAALSTNKKKETKNMNEDWKTGEGDDSKINSSGM